VLSLAYASAYLFPVLKLAAVVHAIRAGVAPYWFCVIVVVPFGEFIYAATVLMPSGSVARRVLAMKPRPLREVRYAFEQNPSLQNQVALAERLREDGAFAEAAALYAEVLGRDASILRAHYGLALCRSEAREPASAIEHWRVVVDANRSYEEYGAWLGMIRDLRALGHCEEALAELEKLVSASPRLAHVVEQCNALADAGCEGAARERLECALRDYEHAPRHVRRESRAAARKANELLAELATATE
jgi:hypothetical protein